MSATVRAPSLRPWFVLAGVTAAVLMLLWWAVSMPAVCAIDLGACPTQETRILHAMIGLVAVLVLVVVSALTAIVQPVWRRAVLLTGAILAGVTGLVLTAVTLFSAGFTLP